MKKYDLDYVTMRANQHPDGSINAVSCADIRALIAERTELLAALEAITERAEDVSQKIPVENRSEGVSQATHVRHMASHLAQHAKLARETIAKAQS